MNILGFDTCLDKMYVTLASDSEIIDSKVIETTKEHYHSAFLISTIKSILKNNNLTPNNVDIIATNIGPGSFTGIRACTTVARVFSQSLGKAVKTVGVSSLEILSRINANNGKTLVALDARKEMAYVAIYENKKEIFAPQAIMLFELKEMLSKEIYFVITDNKLQNIIGGISYIESDNDLGEFLVKIAAEKIENGFEGDWRKLHPLYIQPPPITVKKSQ